MGRLSKWGVEIKAYDIKYALRSAIKGQVLANFVRRYNDRGQPYTGENRWLDDALVEGESMEEQEDMETKAPENLMAETDMWKLYTDGASNKYRSGAEYYYALRLNFANSNNDAKYEALLGGLRIAKK
nr:hypothetical protein [Tanacetum cinerariifolium]